MDYTNILNKLYDTLMVEIDMAHSYRQAREKVEDPHVKKRLTKFHKDHKNHALELTVILTSLRGEEAPEYGEGFSGFNTGGFTLIEGGDTAAVMSMLMENEKIVEAKYMELLAIDDFPPEFHLVVQHYDEREKIHREFLNRKMKEGVTEPG